MSFFRFFSVLKEKKGSFPILVLSLFFFFSCSNRDSQKSRQPLQISARQQAVQDSLARATARNMVNFELKKVREKMSKEKEDTTTHKAEKKSVETQKSNISETNSFDSNGDYAIQVGSWRSQKVANEELRKWKKRGYNNAYLATYGNKSTSNTWYRLRLGHLQTHSAAEQAGKKIAHKYDVHFWVNYVR